MWKTVLILIFTLISVPLIAYNFDYGLAPSQIAILKKLIWVYLLVAILCFIVSSISGNYSQVDKLWSIMPIIYSWVVCFANPGDLRLLLMSILVSIWGIRLTYNFNRRGGYSWKIWEGAEDYRWNELRKKPEFRSKVKWSLFNLFFISLYQMGLILLFSLPILKSMGGGPFGGADIFLGIIFLLLVVIETIADQQQWNYQKQKHQLLAKGVELNTKFSIGFVHSGLWAWMRHPNYTAEQTIWIVFYLFSVVATGHWINWSITGCVLLIILFKGSSDFSEKLSAEKYPEYLEYQKRVPRFIPIFKK